MRLYDLTSGLRNINLQGDKDAHGIPWLNYQDFRAFLYRCFHNSIPVFGVDIYLIRSGVSYYVETLLAARAYMSDKEITYRSWNRHLLDCALESQLSRLQRKAELLVKEGSDLTQLFPAPPLHSSPAESQEDMLCFVPCGDWDSSQNMTSDRQKHIHMKQKVLRFHS